MGYVDDNLMPGEKVEFRTTVHWAVFGPMAGPLFLGTVLAWGGAQGMRNDVMIGIGVALLLVAGVMWLKAYVRRTSTEVAVTNRRVLIKVGILSRHSLELLLSAVEGIGVDQTLTGRLFGYGTILVTGRGGTQEPFHDIANPMEFRRQVQIHAAAGGQAGDARAVPAAGGPFCSQCGGPNAVGARFCSKCGTALAG